MFSLHNRAAFVLVDDGRPQAAIIIDPDAESSIRNAAEDLQYHLRRMSTAEIPIVTDIDVLSAGTVPIWLGITPANLVLPEGVDLNDEKMFWPDGYLIVADQAWGIGVLAPRDKGVVNGVYGILQDYLGCYWFTPGEIGEHIPYRSTVRIEVAGGYDQQKPTYEKRNPWYNGNARARWTPEEVAAVNLWRTRNRAGGAHGYGGHNWYNIYPKSMQEREPQLAPEINGVRTPSGGEAQICLSYPRAVEIGAEYFIRLFNNHPVYDYHSFTQNDNMVFCQCDRCRQYGGNDSERMLKLTNAVAEKTAQVHPDKRITILPYAGAIEIPANHHPPNPNVVAIICSYHMEQILPKTADTHWTNRYRSRAEGWMEMLDKAWSYDYKGWYPGPWPLFANHQKDEDWYRGIGFVGIEAEYLDRNMGTDILQWLTFQTAWNGELEVAELLAIFYPAYYREAAPAMREIFTGFEEHMLRTGGSGEYMDVPKLYPREMVDNALARLEEEQEKAAENNDSVLVARLARDRHCLELTGLFLDFWEQSGRFRRTGGPDERALAEKAGEGYINLLDSLDGTLTVGAAARRFVSSHLNDLKSPGTNFDTAGEFSYRDNLDDGGKVYHAVSRSGFQIDTYGLYLAPGASGTVTYLVQTTPDLRFQQVYLHSMYMFLSEGGGNSVEISMDQGETWSTAYQNVHWQGGTLKPDLSKWVAGESSFLLRFRVHNGSDRRIIAIDNWGIGGIIEPVPNPENN